MSTVLGRVNGWLATVLLAELLTLGLQRLYWRTTVGALARQTNTHTHVRLDSVQVVYTTVEADSDYHMRLRDPHDSLRTHFVVAECIPKLPCRRAKVGDRVTVYGIQRRDVKHGWTEIHPVERLEVLR